MDYYVNIFLEYIWKCPNKSKCQISLKGLFKSFSDSNKLKFYMRHLISSYLTATIFVVHRKTVIKVDNTFYLFRNNKISPFFPLFFTLILNFFPLSSPSPTLLSCTHIITQCDFDHGLTKKIKATLNVYKGWHLI